MQSEKNLSTEELIKLKVHHANLINKLLEKAENDSEFEDVLRTYLLATSGPSESDLLKLCKSGSPESYPDVNLEISEDNEKLRPYLFDVTQYLPEIEQLGKVSIKKILKLFIKERKIRKDLLKRFDRNPESEESFRTDLKHKLYLEYMQQR
jgi:hypothetical protein